MVGWNKHCANIAKRAVVVVMVDGRSDVEESRTR